MTQNSAESDIEIDLSKLFKEFHAARGQKDDVNWVETAAGRLMLDDVKISAAKQALVDLLPILKDAQEPAEKLFGDPKVWAKEQQEHWQQSGTPAQDRYHLYSFKQLTQTICISAALLCVLVTIVALIDDGWTTELSWAMLGIPLLIPAISMGIRQFWNLAVRKFTRLRAMLWTATAFAAAAVALAGLAIALPRSPGTASVLWYLAPVPMYALFYYLIEKFSKRNSLAPRSTTSKTEVATHEEWIRQLQESLRLRDDLSDRRIRVIIEDTRAFAVDAEASLPTEFGTPESYAASFAPNTSFRARREALGWTVGSVLIALLLLVSIDNAQSLFSWQSVVFAALLVGTICYAVQGWRKSLKN
ncbi:hypothetical protein [Glutamicibacter sp.]|uniref:hypothetical protein n=1 Tax=Glutamicibacter sp. TaxID=1931995 RepID=UPI002B4A73D3|nr:hypothetical protein [Glutamicibacter sp.]HJX77794.1 hypothetical protein [Glutamicibacter sp.]